MKIAIMGIRGIPANYGGFETFAEEISPRLVQRGHHVTVYGRSNIIDYSDEYYKGVRIKIFPTISHKYFDTIAHTFVSALHSLKEKYDVILICNSANSYISFLPRLVGTPVALNVDGLEWKRDKWNKLGQYYYKLSEWLSTFLPSAIVTDAIVIREYYCKKFKKESTLIPYGTPTEKEKNQNILKEYNLNPDDYILYVSRLEPENNAHKVVKAFEKVKTDKKLVIVGDAPYNIKYIQELKSTEDKRIIFTGYVFGKGYSELQSYAYFYIQATGVGGTHPALLEGMGFGNCILANDVPEHREVLQDTGMFYRSNANGELSNKMQYLLQNSNVVEELRKKAQRRAVEHYSWDKITDQYENLFFRLTRKC